MADPVAALDPSCVWQPDRRKAVIEVLRGLRNNANNEVSGVLYKNAAGEYCYSAPVESTSEKGFSMKVRMPAGAALAGLYHTHPDDGFANDQYFSNGDVRTAVDLNLPSYVKILRTDQIKEFVPGKTTKVRDRREWKSMGDLVQ